MLPAVILSNAGKSLQKAGVLRHLARGGVARAA